MGRKGRMTLPQTSGEKRISKAESNYMLRYKYEHCSTSLHFQSGISLSNYQTSAPVSKISIEMNQKWERSLLSAANLTTSESSVTQPNLHTVSTTSHSQPSCGNQKGSSQISDKAISKLYSKYEEFKSKSLSWLCLESIAKNLNNYPQEILHYLFSQLPLEYTSNFSFCCCLNLDSLLNDKNIQCLTYSQPSWLYLGHSITHQGLLNLVESMNNIDKISISNNESKISAESDHSDDNAPHSWEDLNESNISYQLFSKKKSITTHSTLTQLHFVKSKFPLAKFMPILKHKLPHIEELCFHNVTFEHSKFQMMKDMNEIGNYILSSFFTTYDNTTNATNNCIHTSSATYGRHIFQYLRRLEFHYCNWCTYTALQNFGLLLQQERNKLKDVPVYDINNNLKFQPYEDQESHTLALLSTASRTCLLDHLILPNVTQIVVSGLIRSKNSVQVGITDSGTSSNRRNEKLITDAADKLLIDSFKMNCGIELILLK